MKLTKFDVEVREEFVRQAVRTDLTITGDKLQALLKQHFGHQMRLGRLYKVKRQALAEACKHPRENLYMQNSGVLICRACKLELPRKQE